MNCKPGDLAIVIRAGKGRQNCIGKIVKCVQLTRSVFNEPAWYVEPVLHTDAGKPIMCAEDHCLRPLPPPEDVDDVSTPKEIEHEHA